jgi:hypothetical protein
MSKTAAIMLVILCALLAATMLAPWLMQATGPVQ